MSLVGKGNTSKYCPSLGSTDSQKAMTTPLGSLFFSDSALSSRSVLEFSQKWCWAANLQYQNLDPQAQQKRPTN
jgi:chorismate-pyruvate lyase